MSTTVSADRSVHLQLHRRDASEIFADSNLVNTTRILAKTNPAYP